MYGQCAATTANLASPKSNPPKEAASATAIKGKSGNLIAPKSSSCDADLRTPKKLHNTIRIILRKLMIYP
jgi:hypothetical protein